MKDIKTLGIGFGDPQSTYSKAKKERICINFEYTTEGNWEWGDKDKFKINDVDWNKLKNLHTCIINTHTNTHSSNIICMFA